MSRSAPGVGRTLDEVDHGTLLERSPGPDRPSAKAGAPTALQDHWTAPPRLPCARPARYECVEEFLEGFLFRRHANLINSRRSPHGSATQSFPSKPHSVHTSSTKRRCSSRLPGRPSGRKPARATARLIEGVVTCSVTRLTEVVKVGKEPQLRTRGGPGGSGWGTPTPVTWHDPRRRQPPIADPGHRQPGSDTPTNDPPDSTKVLARSTVWGARGGGRSFTPLLRRGELAGGWRRESTEDDVHTVRSRTTSVVAVLYGQALAPTSNAVRVGRPDTSARIGAGLLRSGEQPGGQHARNLPGRLRPTGGSVGLDPRIGQRLVGQGEFSCRMRSSDDMAEVVREGLTGVSGVNQASPPHRSAGASREPRTAAKSASLVGKWPKQRAHPDSGARATSNVEASTPLVSNTSSAAVE